MTVAARPVAPGLHVVATPIGNLGDMTLRGLATLAAADLIACEDTRVTRVLLDRYAISRPLIPYHEHNAAIQRPRILAELAAGKAVALVSDAGTPLISDPGYRLAAEAIEAGFAVIPVPGASAMLAALVASGLPTDAFYFAGFLPQKQGPRRKRLAALATVPGSLVVYESPKRLAACLADMAEVLGGDRPAAVARELTKTFETVRRGTLAGLAGGFAAEATPKGEIVVVVGPPGEAAAPDAAAIDELLAGLLATESLRSAADEAAALTGLPRRDLYQRALALKNRADDGDG
ncbi:16S rRNA (cytidine(1402)-2'-O)-methyltransferase [Bauldia sp.]|uniref:16S rRNA (cytidine(1402)-2'-O)-methyltransferase n=1 Tax=Bauldia sp. TaxID=2575872 RepID=UPI0025C2C8B0|nr:16S rRNA (cytidine(1402)-2'-O)-methyltransferase [Bauldia sp.]